MWAPDADSALFKVLSLHETVDSFSGQVNNAPWLKDLWFVIRQSTGKLSDLIATEKELYQAYLQHADVFHWMLRFIEASKIGRIPHTLIAPMKMLVERYGVPFDLVVWCDWVPANYSIHGELSGALKRAIGALFEDELEAEEVLSKVPDVLAIVSIPASDRDNVLQHAVLAHEMGHALVNHYHDLDECGKKLVPVTPTQTQPKTTQKTTIKDDQLDLFKQQQLINLVETLTKWVNELLADVWAIRLLGPSALLALHHAVGPQAASSTHPPTYLRGKVMLEALRVSGFYPCAGRSELEWLGRTYDVVEQAIVSTKAPDTETKFYPVQQLLDDKINIIVDHVMNRCAAPQPFTATAWEAGYVGVGPLNRTHELAERLLYHTCPDVEAGRSKTGRENAVPAIILAGWYVRLHEPSWIAFCESLGANGPKGRHIAFKKLNSLVSKALEIEYINRQIPLA